MRLAVTLGITTLVGCAAPATPASAPVVIYSRDPPLRTRASDISQGTIFERMDCIPDGHAKQLWFEPNAATTSFCVRIAGARDLMPCYSVTTNGTYVTEQPRIDYQGPEHREPAPEYLHRGGHVENASASLHAEWDPSTPDDGPKLIETFDDRKGARLARFKAGTTTAPHVAVAFVADTLVISEQDDAFGATAWLATAKGRRLAALGGTTPLQTVRLGPVQIAGPVWAFASSDGDVVVLQNVATGRVDRMVTLGDKGHEADMVGDAAHLVIVYGGDRTGEIAVVELASGTVEHHVPKRCR